MKKYILILFFITGLIFILSCQKGDKGITGPQGNMGSEGETGYLVKQFQDGVFPSTTYSGTADTRIISGANSNLNFGSCFNIEFGYDLNKVFRVLMKFDVSTIPVSATVKSAYLTLYCYGNNGMINVVAYKVIRDWIEGTGSCSGIANVNASWDYYNGVGNSWTTPGGDYDLTTQSEVKTVTTTGYYTIKLNTNMVQNWVNSPSSNYGMIIKAVDETTFYLANYDKTNWDKSKRPKLTIYYTLP